MLIIHTARYTGIPWEILKSVVPNNFEIRTLGELNYDNLINEVENADYLLVSGRLPIDKDVLSAAKHLKMIQRTGVGTEMLDIDAIKKRDIPVYVNAGINARSVAEHTLTLILSCLKRVPIIDKQVRSGVWKKQETGVSCHELYGKTVGLVGMGAIGRQVAKYLSCLGTKIIYTDLYRLSEEQESSLEATYVSSFEELLSLVDILSFHCPLTDDNHKILDAKAISMMKDGAIVVNTARGKLIDEAALYDALKSEKLASAGLDVHYEEPMMREDPLCTLDNVIFSPHIAGLSYETFQAMMKNAIDNIVAFEEGRFSEIENKKLAL